MKRIKDYILTAIFIGTLSYEVTILAQESPQEEELSAEETQDFESATRDYDAIIYTEEPIETKLRFRAMYDKAEMLFDNEYSSPQDRFQEARRLLDIILAAPQHDVATTDWAQAHILLAKMDTAALALPGHNPNYRAAGDHYIAVLNEKNLFDFEIIFDAANEFIKLFNEYPRTFEEPKYQQALAFAYYCLVDAYEKMSHEEKTKNIKDMKVFNNYRLFYAQKLSQGTMKLPEDKPGYTKAIKLYSAIIQSLPDKASPQTKNSARVNLADMNMRGQGSPNNKPDIQRALVFYRQVLHAPENEVVPRDRSKAQRAIRLYYSQKLSQIFEKPEDYTKAIALHRKIIKLPESEVDPKTLNKARVNLAGMYMRGDADPGNTPAENIQAALALYQQVMREPEGNVDSEDRSRAQVAIPLAEKRQLQEEAPEQQKRRKP